MKEILVVYNPVSGSKKGRDLKKLISCELEKMQISATWFETKPCKAQDFSSLKDRQYERVLVCGGDGTIAEVATWLIREKRKTSLAILPTGSANVLAHSLGLHFFDTKKGLREALSLPSKPLDVLRVNRNRLALVAVGRGYDAVLMEATTRSEKRKFGPLAYVFAFLKTFFFYRSKAYKISIDGKRHFLVAKSVVALNLAPVPELILSGRDGLLTLFTVSRWFRIRRWQAKTVSIKCKQELSFELDGEVFKSKTVNVEVLPGALNVVYKKFLFEL